MVLVEREEYCVLMFHERGAKAIVGLRPSFSVHVRFGERGAPVDSLRRGSEETSLSG
jgi:hypothetical protein